MAGGVPRWLVVFLDGWWCSSMAGGVPLWWLVVCLVVAGGVILDGWWCIPGGWWSIQASGRILPPGTPQGVHASYSVRRRSRLNGSLSGFFLIGYCSIYQLFKFSYRMPYAKVFTGENLIKTLFSINYRGYFIIQAAHTTTNYSYFLHKTDRKHVENQ